MAIYNIDNIRSINEDKSDIARYDATAKDRARHRSLAGHTFKADKNSDHPKGYYHNEPSYKAAKRKYDDDVRKGRYGEQSTNQYSYSFRRQLTTGRKQTATDKFRADEKNAQYISELNKRNKLKEAAQYILDVLDEQEYYDEYDNSNDYYYYE